MSTNASTPHILERLAQASNSDRPFTQIPRSVSDVQMYLLVFKFEAGLGISQLAREWSINLTHRAEHEKWLQGSYAKDEWTQEYWDSVQRRSPMAIRLRHTGTQGLGRGSMPQKIQRAKVENDIMNKEIGWNGALDGFLHTRTGLVVESVPALVEGSIDPRLMGMHSEARSINMALVRPQTSTETMDMRCVHDVAVLTLSRNSQRADSGM
ncbi:hypothetical protein B0H13DRAFT_1880623 [Mycena leptocephala]|nr:hypothetical protein B0H13DRAFT_1880623 [Mycena leptocephala]